MKKIIFLFAFLVSQSSQAENICPTSSNIPDDVRILESELTKEAAEEALLKLSKIISNPKEPRIWTTLPNLNRTIEGYVFKRDTLAKLSKNPKADVSAFCAYMERAYWYD